MCRSQRGTSTCCTSSCLPLELQLDHRSPVVYLVKTRIFQNVQCVTWVSSGADYGFWNWSGSGDAVQAGRLTLHLWVEDDPAVIADAVKQAPVYWMRLLLLSIMHVTAACSTVQV